MTGASRGPAAWSPLKRRCLGLLFASPMYRATLPRRIPQSLLQSPPDAWPGVADRGAAILGGVFTLAGTRIRAEASPFDVDTADPDWRQALHQFAWLRDLRAKGGDAARLCAREHVAEWLSRHERWSPDVWRSDVVGRRIVNWMAYFELFFASAPDAFRRRLLASIAKQAGHLSRAYREIDGMGRIAAIKGLLYSGLCLPGEDPLLARAISLLDTELTRQIDDDGGHIDRSPSGQLMLLRDLIDMRAALSAGDQTTPDFLGDAIDRTASLLRFFRHGDGGLAAFNGGGSEDAAAINLALDQANVKSSAPKRGSACGFERLSGGKLLLIVDAGAPVATNSDNPAHAGTVSFEASYGKNRLIVNCAASHAAGLEWRAAARATAAHSTLTLEDTNSSEIHDDGRLGKRIADVVATREESDGDIWLSLSHDGYERLFGLSHLRRLYITAKGDEIRGEDSLRLAPAMHGPSKIAPDLAYAIRFHIHPAVRVSMAQDGATVFLRQNDGIGWRMRVAGARIDLAESAYFGGETARRTQQIVLSGRTGTPPTIVKWAFRREGA